MAIDLVAKFSPYVDEALKAESKRNLLTNQDYDWTGAHSVKVYKVSTAKMNDYDRDGSTLAGDKWSRYGVVQGLDATTEELTLKNDRSFTFAIDKLAEDETANVLNAAAALARQTREVVVPEMDGYTYHVMCHYAGKKPAPITLNPENIYTEILRGSTALDDAEAPETNRTLVVTPATYAMMKKSPDITMETDIGQEQRQRGVIAMLDGCSVVKVPANRVPTGFGFMIAHPSATVAPAKLEEYKVHLDPPGISGSLVEGRICYDAFVLDNKKNAIYYQAISTPELKVTSAAGSASGMTKITVEPVASSGNTYKYMTGASVDLPAMGEDCSTGWTDWDGTSNITAATGDEIVIVEVNGDAAAVRAGKTPVTSKA